MNFPRDVMKTWIFFQVGDSISMIKVHLQCSSLQDNPQMQTLNASGWMSAINSDSVFSGPNNKGEDRFSSLAEGIYQLCFRPAAIKDFSATGLMITVQSKILMMSVNQVKGTATAAPSSTGNSIKICSDINCTLQKTGIIISFIAPSFSCELGDHNPSQPGPFASGFLVPANGDSNSILPIDQLSLDVLFVGAKSLNPGVLQVCFRDDGSTAFITTGLSFTIQDNLLRLIVNGVETDSSPKATIPIADDQKIGFFRHYPGDIGEQISFVPLTGYI
jgi:hypothetical protein